MEIGGVSRRTGIKLRFVEVGDDYQTDRVGVRVRSVGLGNRIGFQGGAVGVLVQLVVGLLPLRDSPFRTRPAVADLHRELGVDEIRNAVKNFDIHSIDRSLYARAVNVVVFPREDIVRRIFPVRVYHKFETHLVAEAVAEKHIPVIVRVEVTNPVEVKHCNLPARGKVAVFGLGRGELKLTGVKERLSRLRNREGEINGLYHRLVLSQRICHRQHHRCRRKYQEYCFSVHILYCLSDYLIHIIINTKEAVTICDQCILILMLYVICHILSLSFA